MLGAICGSAISMDLPAQTMDPSIVQADPWISQIHRLRPTQILIALCSNILKTIDCGDFWRPLVV